MKVIDFLKRLEKEECFIEFKKENSDAFLCAIFCILTKAENEGDKIQFDFYMPSKKKVAYSENPFREIIFSKEDGKEFSELSNLKNLKIELEDLWEELEKIKQKEKINHSTNKIIAVLTEGLWNLTCLSNVMDIVRIKVNSLSGEVLDIKKAGLADFVRLEKKK